jgi:PAS domain S-box-containing protein
LSAIAPQDAADNYANFLIGSVPVLLAYIDADFCYRYANPAYCAWFGHSPNAVIGHPVGEIIGQSAFQSLRPYMEAAFAGMPVTFEQEINDAETDSRYVHVALVPDMQEDGFVQGISAALTDITDRQRAEEQNRKSQEELSLVLAGARCFLWYADVIINPASDPDDPEAMLHWETRFAEETALRHFGITVLPGQDVAATWHLSRVDEDRRRDDLNAVRHIRAGKDYSQEFRCRRADGSLIWLKEDVRVKKREEGHWWLVGVSTEITDRKQWEIEREQLLVGARQAHAQLQQSEAYLRLAVEGAGVGIWLWDLSTDKRIWSPESKALFGFPEDQEITAETLYNALHLEDRQRWNTAMDQALTGQSRYQIEYRVLWPDGSLHWLEAKGGVAYDESGQVIRLEGVLLDIGERKRLEEELAAAAHDHRRISEALQRSLLSEPSQDVLDRLSVKTLYQPATDQMLIGGDFYDWVSLENGKVALVVGDLVGKGLQAATSMAEVKFTLRAFLTEFPSPARALERLNHFLLGGSGQSAHLGLVSLILAVFDPETGLVTCAVAAADPPLVLRTAGTIEEVDAGGLPLGAISEATYEDTTIHLEDGDLLILVTDGLSEARRDGVFFGREGVIQAAKQALPLGSTDTIAQAILETSREFAGGRFQDDVCLLVAQRRFSGILSSE